MPLPVDRLTEKSADTKVKEAISESIKMCMEEGGRSQKQCTAIAYSIARKKTGKQLSQK